MRLLNTYFLGINLAFWLIGLPFGILIFYTRYIDINKEKLRKEELISRLPNSELRFDINKEERWMLNRLKSMGNYSSDDKFFRNEIKEIIAKECNNLCEEFDD